MFRNVLLITCRFQEPVTRAMGVGHGFLSGEGFRGYQEQRGFRVYFFQHFRDVSPIDVRNKVHVQVVFVWTQCFSHHVRAEVRTADPDVHYVSDCFAGISFPLTGNNRFREGFHLLQHCVDFRHYVFAINQNRGIATVTQRYVQHGTVFSAVDLLAREHRLNRARQIALFRQIL
ncbi:hypothetical protein HmCmsJML084_02633 [Escherichia coli]|nr:hypothetical protein HmCmsJML084_02633 [Escherichia coli]